MTNLYRLFLSLMLLVVVALAGALPALAAGTQKRAALVIGNSAYSHVPALANPVNDARAMSARLEGLGFQVVKVLDGSQRSMLDGLSRFGRAAVNADVALVFYAGHGAQVAGRNWLLPVSADIRAASDLPAQAIRMNDLIEVMDASNAKVKLVFLDACRNNPLKIAQTRSTSRGLARIEASAAGTLIAFATAPGTTADDGNGKHSPFTTALLQYIARPGLEIRRMIGRVRETVYNSTNRTQLPWMNEALIGDVYLAGKPGQTVAAAPPVPQPVSPQPAVPQPAAPQPAGPSEKEVFELARSIDTVDAWNAFLTRFPSGTYALFAKAARDKLKAKAAPVPQPVQPQGQGGSQTALAVPPDPRPVVRQRSLDGFMFPDSNRRRLRARDLDGLSRSQLRVARNEIFARRGRYFKSPDLQAHFGQFSWYRPYTWKPRLNRTERANVRLILRLERGR